MNNHHDLRTQHKPFAAILDGRQRFEIRSTNDRTFAVGDTLRLREWRPPRRDEEIGVYSGREIRAVVTCLDSHGLPDGLCVIGFATDSDAVREAARALAECADRAAGNIDGLRDDHMILIGPDDVGVSVQRVREYRRAVLAGGGKGER